MDHDDQFNTATGDKDERQTARRARVEQRSLQSEQ